MNFFKNILDALTIPFTSALLLVAVIAAVIGNTILLVPLTMINGKEKAKKQMTEQLEKFLNI